MLRIPAVQALTFLVNASGSVAGLWCFLMVLLCSRVITLRKNTVKVVRVFRQELEEVGGFFPLQIVEENGKVVRRERRSEHIVK